MKEITIQEAQELCQRTLAKAGYAEKHVQAITAVLLQAQIDDCHSHGLYRLLNCVTSIEKNTVSADAEPILNDISPSVLKVDVQKGMASLTLQHCIPVLADKAKEQGIALLALNHCVHTTALWYEVELLVKQGLVGFACTSNHAWVVPEGGKIPLFGTNPIAFGWPRPHGADPFLFDFAMTSMARGDLELYAKAEKQVPDGCGVDAEGNSSNDPDIILNQGSMKTFGGHKGSALAAMVELLAGPLIGDVLSLESQRLDDGAGGSPLGGELIIAISPQKLLGSLADHYLEQAEVLFEGYKQQNLRLPSQRRYQARKRNLSQQSVHIKERVYQSLIDYLAQS